MCGISAKLSFTAQEIDRTTLERMCAALEHRGPDGLGIHVRGRVGLGQRRLSIIDLSPSGTAPLPNEDQSIWATLNGEIYNFSALRAELIAQGHRFRTGTDTEVLVHLYEEHGHDLVHRLDGMFAFVIWDERRQRLLAVRDRLGKKPLFYARTAGALSLASSITALLSDAGVSREPDFNAIDEFLTWQYVPSPDSAFLGIKKVRPGHLLTCDAEGHLNIQRYWRAPLGREGAADTRDDAEIEAELLDRLRAAVRKRMLADVPLGAFLSGGLDSSAVVGLMAESSVQPVKTFSIGFDESDFNELPYARAIAERFGTDHHEFVVRPEATDVLPTLVKHFGEPFADSSALPTYYLSKLTREHVTVALSGDGGDENFAGYENYRIVSAWSVADGVPAGARRLAHAGVRELTQRLPAPLVARRIARATEMWASSPEGRFRLQCSILKPDEKHSLYTPRFAAFLDDLRSNRRLPEPAIPPGVSPIAWMMWHDLQYYLPDCLMVKVDVASMATGLEVRSPFLDHHLVEFAARIPTSSKFGEDGGKLVLKRALRSILPAETMNRPKKGFGVPIQRWFSTGLLEVLRGLLLDERAARRGLFDPSMLRRLVDDHTSGRRDVSTRLWALLCLELWFREFID